jgi:zinc transporter ZupT
MNNVLLALLAGTGFAFAGMASIAGVRVGRTARALSVGVAAGILITIAIADLIPEALKASGVDRAVGGVLAGFLVLFAIETVTRGHGHHHDDVGHHGHDHHHHHAVVPFMIGLGLHNFTDGFAIGTSAELSHSAAVAVAIGVIIHQLPVGLSVAAVFGAENMSSRHVIKAIVGMALAIPLGALFIAALPDLSTSTSGMLGAVSAGALLYIGAGHLLPEAHAEEPSWTVALGFPVTVVLTALLFLRVLAD